MCPQLSQTGPEDSHGSLHLCLVGFSGKQQASAGHTECAREFMTGGPQPMRDRSLWVNAQLPCALHRPILRCVLHSLLENPQQDWAPLTHTGHPLIYKPPSSLLPSLCPFPTSSLCYLGWISKYSHLHQNLCLRSYWASTLACLSQGTVKIIKRKAKRLHC